jgi:putative tryptophan/tyrosine transport system substrate-binding protein
MSRPPSALTMLLSRHTKRRDFIAGLGAAAWPLAARGQQRTMPVIGVLDSGRPGPSAIFIGVLLEGLNDGGYIEGRNFAIEYRWAEGRNDRLPALAADLVQRQVNVIFAGSTPAALAAKAATTTIPIVFHNGLDPVKAGLVARLNAPGGNVTGMSNISTAFAAKRLELLHQLAPKGRSVGILVDPTGAASDAEKTELQEAANALDLQLTVLNASTEQEIDAAFATLVQRQIGALLLADFPFFNDRREQLVALARSNGIPTMYTFREFALAGGLISYASSGTQGLRRAGNYIARILNGEKPSDLPVQLPTKFELVINMKTAKALGLSIPPTLLALADEVIE